MSERTSFNSEVYCLLWRMVLQTAYLYGIVLKLFFTLYIDNSSNIKTGFYLGTCCTSCNLKDLGFIQFTP